MRYIDLKAGPEYKFHYKLASTLLVVYAAVIFGPILPMMFPLAMAAMVVKYVFEKLTLTYFYRVPAKYSAKLTVMSIKLMMLAPLISFALTYWAFSNRQMFENKVSAISTFGEIQLSYHLVGR